MQALLAHQPQDLLPQQQLQTLEVELTGVVARKVFLLALAGFTLATGDAAGLAEVVVFVDVELDVALGKGVSKAQSCKAKKRVLNGRGRDCWFLEAEG